MPVIRIALVEDDIRHVQKIKEYLDPSMSGFAIQGYEVEALDYIVKPVSYELFARKLERAIDRLSSDSGYSVLISSRC